MEDQLMNESDKYHINIEPAFGYLELIDLPHILKKNKEKWFNQTLCRVNNSFFRLGVFEGEFHWHKHFNEDELFFVLEGNLTIETEKGTFVLNKYQGVCIPKGTLHRPIAKERTIVIMIELDTIKPKGD